MIAGVLFGVAQIELQHGKEQQALGIADAKKRAIYINPTPGVEVQGVSDSIIHTPKDVVELTSKAFDSF